MSHNAQKHTPNRDEDFTKRPQKDKLGVTGAGLCCGGVVVQFKLFPAQGMMYSLALMCHPLLNRCNKMA